MKRLLVALAGLFAVLALALFLSPYLIPQSVLERHLRPLLADATGLHLQEAQRLRLSLYPEPGVALETVRATFAEDQDAPSDLRTDRITAALAIPALWDGKLQLSKLVFERPSIVWREGSFERGDAAPADPLFKKTASETTGRRPTSRARRPAIDVEIIDGAVFIEQKGANEKQIVGDADLVLKSPGGGEPIRLDGTLQLWGQAVSVNTVATPDAQVRKSLSALKVALRSEAGAMELDGAVRSQPEKRFTGTAQLSLTSGQALARWIGGDGASLARMNDSHVTGQLDITNERLTLSDGVFSAPGAQGDLALQAEKGGMIRARLENLTLHGGDGQGTFSLDASQAEKIFGASFSMRNVDALALSKGLFGFDWISGGAEAELNLAGGGHGLDEIAATLKGTGRLTVTDGAIEGLDLPKLVAEANDAEFGNWRREDGLQTPFDRLNGTYVIENGIATTQDLKLTGPNVEVIGKGKTDFARERIDYRLKATVAASQDGERPASGGEQAALTVPVVVQGDWDEPDIYPDVENALKDPEGLRGSAKLLGKSVEKLTDGKVKSDDFGKLIDGLFGKKKSDD